MEEEKGEAVAMHEIVSRLYLGSILAASDKNLLIEHKITHILTVALDVEPEWPTDFTYKTVGVLDMESANLLTHMDDCTEFIHNAMENNGVVLVHCNAGVSRSTTIVVAYLMRDRGMGREEALAFIRDIRPQVYPNHGFMMQLSVYHALLKNQQGCPSPEDLELIKRYKLERGCIDVEEWNGLSEEFYHKLGAERKRWECNKCRYKLFNHSHIIQHMPGQDLEPLLLRASNNRKKAEFKRKQEQKGNNNKNCTSLFIVGMDWMKASQIDSATHVAEDTKLMCPGGCGSAIGLWTWKGIHCNCGTWIEPAFQISKSKVMEFK